MHWNIEWCTFYCIKVARGASYHSFDVFHYIYECVWSSIQKGMPQNNFEQTFTFLNYFIRKCRIFVAKIIALSRYQMWLNSEHFKRSICSKLLVAFPFLYRQSNIPKITVHTPSSNINILSVVYPGNQYWYLLSELEGGLKFFFFICSTFNTSRVI